MSDYLGLQTQDQEVDMLREVQEVEKSLQARIKALKQSVKNGTTFEVCWQTPSSVVWSVQDARGLCYAAGYGGDASRIPHRITHIT